MSLLDDQLKIMKEYIYDSLKDTLKKLIPEPDMLEAKCNIVIPQKNIKIEKFKINPSAKVNTLKLDLTTHFLKLNNPIQTFDDKVAYIVIIPSERSIEFAHLIDGKDKSLFDSKDSLINFIKSLEQKQNLQVVNLSSEELFAKQKISQNCTILFYGMFLLKNEAPAQCMTYDYKQGTMMNYFSCENCKINCKYHIFKKIHYVNRDMYCLC